MRRITTIVLTVLLSAAAAEAHDLLLHYDFSQVSGTKVTDASPSACDATLRGSAKVEQMGRYAVLNLGTASGYLDMTAAAGKVLAAAGDYTVSVYHRVDDDASLSGAGYFLWAFSTSTACTATGGAYTAYRLNAQRVATSTGGYQNERGIERGSAADRGHWQHVAFVQSGTTGRLYIDGTLVGSTQMPANATAFATTAPAYCWIGRAPFSGDAYLTRTLVADFRLYAAALTAAEVSELAATTADLDYEYRYGGEGDFTALQTAVQTAQTFLAGINKTQYPPSALLEYQDAINVANALIAEGKANQTTIDNCRTALQTARTTLTSVRGKTFDTSAVLTGYDADRGFLHPGGLHTEADFIRIKKQLAEGNERVTAAYNVLKNAEYAQAGCSTWPTEYIVRGGDGQNYINAARGATIAYQNALRWKIDGTRANADAAVRTLMAWCNQTKGVTGTSDQCLAYGLYGYEFAQAAELMRDYDGWSRDDFAKFQRWMLDVWYPGVIGFMRGRNGTWENADKWWQAPGHYWSNWGLCNALALISIGVLCDDVFIYNQGLSFIKYDQVGTFTNPRTADPILNDGLTEFWGNLIVTTYESELETGAYGRLGQMNESGRDTGHAAMAAGLAVDIAHMLYNQGDDLFAFMDHRLAAGIEYIAAQTQSVEGLPWVNYHYANNGYYYSDSRSWLMTGPALGAQMRPYWGTVIGHYEGVKGVEMPFSHRAYDEMGIDGGGLGATSGGYDHLGYSVLMNTRTDGLAPADKVPTELSGKVMYGGRTYTGNELGGLKNNYKYIANQGFQAGTEVTLMPCLPEGEEDTGLWQWTTGETTRNITITANESRVYHVTYTNKNGVESQQVFTIAVDGDCQAATVVPYINGVQQTEADVDFGSSVTLSTTCIGGWGSILWDNGQTTYSITIPAITTSRDVRAIFTNQGGRQTMVTFHLNVRALVPNIQVGTTRHDNTAVCIVAPGNDVTLMPTPAAAFPTGNYAWIQGGTVVSTDPTYTFPSIDESQFVTVAYIVGTDTMGTIDYQVFVKPRSDQLVEPGNYLIYCRAADTYLTNTDGGNASPSLHPLVQDLQGRPAAAQVWYINRPSTARYDFTSLSDSLQLNAAGKLIARTVRPLRISTAAGTEYVQIYTSTGGYWTPNADGTITFDTADQPLDFPFQLIPVDAVGDDADAINHLAVPLCEGECAIYNVNGQQLQTLQRGLNIVGGRKVIVK